MSPDQSKSGSERNADLKLVDRASKPESGSGSASAGTGDDAPRRRGVPIWLFVLLLVAGAIVLGWQLQNQRTLEAEVARVEDELARSTALLDAHRARLDEIRVGIRDLSLQIDSLRGLADSDLTEAVESGDSDVLESGETLDETADPALLGDPDDLFDPAFGPDSAPF